MSLIGALVDVQAREAGWPRPEREYKVDSGRRYRWDFCWPAQRVSLDVEGGLFAKGRARMAHAMPTAILRDMNKANIGTLNGWRMLRLTPEQVRAGELTMWLRKMDAAA